MCQRNKRTDEADLRALYDVLEGRYGLELAIWRSRPCPRWWNSPALWRGKV
jgi:hypothetical protein